MNPILGHIKDPGFQFPDSISPAYKHLLLPGSEIKFAQGESGTILIQDIIQPEFQIHYRVYDLQIPLQLPARQEKTFLIALLSLKNSIQYFIRGLGRFNLKQGQFALLQTTEQEASIHFEKKNSHHCLEISWSKEMLEQVSTYFPSTKPLFSGKEKNKSFYLNRPGQPAGTLTLDIVHAILKTRHKEEIALHYFKHKVQEFLLSVLTDAENSGLKIPLTPIEHEKIISVAERLTKYKNHHFPIAKLAKEVHMNEMKLKQGFKKIFGKGIFEYQLEARMNEAHRLLRETDLGTKAIASLVGYELATSFITKFREYFGYPPSEVEKDT